MIYEDFFDMVGNTPIVRFNSCLGKGITSYMKLEGSNPSGSVKDRAALALIRDKIDKGELAAGKTILDASSGSFACSIAMFGHVLGFPVKVVTGSKITEDKIAFVNYFGASRISHGNFTIDGNRLCSTEIIEQEPGRYCFLDQLHNWANPDIHYETTGPEILRDLPDVSAVAFSLGSGGTLNGVGRFLRDSFAHACAKVLVAARR